MPRKNPDFEVMLLLHSDPQPNGCVLWTGATVSRSYGLICSHGQKQLAHRWSYRYFVGPFHRDLDICHSCDTPLCINPDHLFVGDATANGKDASGKGRVKHGEMHWNARLTTAQAREIRTSAGTQAAIAARFGVSPSTVSLIKRGKWWKHA